MSPDVRLQLVFLYSVCFQPMIRISSEEALPCDESRGGVVADVSWVVVVHFFSSILGC